MIRLIGALILLAGIGFGLYVGGWILFIGGIAQIIAALQVVPVVGTTIGIGIFKIVIASTIGMIIFWICAAIGIPMLVIGNDFWSYKRRRR